MEEPHRRRLRHLRSHVVPTTPEPAAGVVSWLRSLLGGGADSSGGGADDEELVVTTVKQLEWAAAPSDADYDDLAHANRAGAMAFHANEDRKLPTLELEYDETTGERVPRAIPASSPPPRSPLAT
eukprot:COSAG04_NODE_5160_length_1717_cov_1.594561_2_plen_125_part_00